MILYNIPAQKLTLSAGRRRVALRVACGVGWGQAAPPLRALDGVQPSTSTTPCNSKNTTTCRDTTNRLLPAIATGRCRRARAHDWLSTASRFSPEDRYDKQSDSSTACSLECTWCVQNGRKTQKPQRLLGRVLPPSRAVSRLRTFLRKLGIRRGTV